MPENKKRKSSGKLKLLCAGLLLLACCLGISAGAYARYRATYRANHDITLNVTAGTYVVVFHYGNTDDRESYEMVYKVGEQVTMPAVSEYYTRTGYTGTGWDTTAEGGGDYYEQGYTGENLAEGGTTLHLYARWSTNVYTVSYDTNGGDDTVADEEATYGSIHTLSSQIPVREHYTFLGWFSQAKDGEQLESVEVLDDVTVYAHWKPDVVKITYLPNMLPKGYTQVQWIGGDGDSYIKTDVKLNEDSQVRVIYEMVELASESETGTSGQSAGIFGIEGDEGFGAALENGQLSLKYGEAASLLSDGTGTTGKHEIYANRHVWRLDGEETAAYTYAPFETGGSALVFGETGGSGYIKGRIYGVQFRNRSGLVSSLVPAVNGAGNPGLYDIKKRYFRANAGKGEFAVGPEVTGESCETLCGSVVQAIEDPFEKNGYHLVCWNTKADGSGESYIPGTDITVNGDMTLYAIWKAEYPVLGTGHSWYDRSKGGAQSGYTAIHIVDEIPMKTASSADAAWNADAGDEGRIRCYRVGTQLWIAGDGTGAIGMAADPSGMFGDLAGSDGEAGTGCIFTNVESIDGLDLLDTSKCETLAWLFSAKPQDTGAGGGITVDDCLGMTALTDIRGIEAWDVSQVKSMEGMCCDLESLTTVSDVSYWDTSKVTSLELAFAGCSALEELDLRDWDTSAVVNIRRAFSDCSKLGGLRVCCWGASQMTELSYAFARMGCESESFALDLSGWKPARAVSTEYMFLGCDKLRTIYVSSEWVLSGEVDSDDMFSGCTILTGGAGTVYSSAHMDGGYAHVDAADDPGYLSLSTAKVIAAGDVLNFTYKGGEYKIGDTYGGETISAIYEIPVESKKTEDIGWYELKDDIKTVKVERCIRTFRPKSLDYWFSDLKMVTAIEGMNFINASEATSMQYTFRALAFRSEEFVMDLSGWDVSKVTTFKGAFYDAGQYADVWTIGNLGGWNTSSATDLSEMFYGASSYGRSWYVGDIGKWDVSHVTTFNSFAFETALLTNTVVVDLSAWDTSSATDMSHMFDGMGYVSAEWSVGNLKNWDTSHVTTMEYMFKSTGSYGTKWYLGDISQWDTSQVTNMRGMFYDAASSLRKMELDLSGWNTGKVTDMSVMLQNIGQYSRQCTIKGLENWDVSQVSDMSGMFKNCGMKATGFTLNLSGWNTQKLSNTSEMFQNMSSVETIYVGSGWNMSGVTSSTGMFEGDAKLIGGNGTVYDSTHIDKEYARIDAEGTPGYLTAGQAENSLMAVMLTTAGSEDLQQKYLETLLMYEGSLYDSATGEFIPGTSPQTGVEYASKEEWLQSEEYKAWSDECDILKSLLEAT